MEQKEIIEADSSKLAFLWKACVQCHLPDDFSHYLMGHCLEVSRNSTEQLPAHALSHLSVCRFCGQPWIKGKFKCKVVPSLKSSTKVRGREVSPRKGSLWMRTSQRSHRMNTQIWKCGTCKHKTTLGLLKPEKTKVDFQIDIIPDSSLAAKVKQVHGKKFSQKDMMLMKKKMFVPSPTGIGPRKFSSPKGNQLTPLSGSSGKKKRKGKRYDRLHQLIMEKQNTSSSGHYDLHALLSTLN